MWIWNELMREEIPGRPEKIRGHPGSNRGPLDLQSNALPLSYIPICTDMKNIYLIR